MSTLLEFWRKDGTGEALIRSRRCKILDALGEAATTRSLDCVLVTLRDTRPDIPEQTLWKQPGYSSSTVSAEELGLLNLWKQYI